MAAGVHVRRTQSSVGLSRQCISRLVLNVGVTISDTGTSAPLRGFRPVRAPRILTANTPKTRLHTIPPRQGGRNRAQDRVDDDLHIPLIQMRVLLSDPLELRCAPCGLEPCAPAAYRGSTPCRAEPRNGADLGVSHTHDRIAAGVELTGQGGHR